MCVYTFLLCFSILVGKGKGIFGFIWQKMGDFAVMREKMAKLFKLQLKMSELF